MFHYEHTAIIVTDMDRSIRFYEAVFGFALRFRKARKDREMAFLYMKNAPQIELELIRDIEPVGEYAQSGIVNHIAFRVQNLEEALAVVKKHHETAPDIKQTIEGDRMVLFGGPDGELLQLIEKNS